MIIAVNISAILIKDRSLVDAALKQQRNFAGSALGGIFLSGDSRFIHLKYDTSLVKKVPGQLSSFTIKKNTPYIYYEDSHHEDTLYCGANMDTISVYRVVDMNPPANSNIDPGNFSGNTITPLAGSLYYSLFFPLFFNAHGPLQLLASIENLFVILSLIVIIQGIVCSKKENLFPIAILFFAIGICILTGFTTPNAGAIFRYRSPAIIFIFMAALYYIEWPRITIGKKEM